MKRIKLITLMMLLFATGVFAQLNFFQTMGAGQIQQARDFTTRNFCKATKE